MSSSERAFGAARALAAAAALCLGLWAPLAASAAEPQALPRPAHVVIVIEENKAFRQIIGNPEAPYINALAREGALFTQSHAVTHPSQPNYLALFSGSTHGVRDDGCLAVLSGANLASELLAKGYSFATYSESLPHPGYAGCAAGLYERKHNPAVNWQGVNVPAAANLPFDAFPADYAKLPTVAIVVPNMVNDMHDGPQAEAIAAGDRWLQRNLEGYVRWARTHDSLLVLTWDEDDGSIRNHIPTLFVGAHVRPGKYAERIDHYSVLRTLAAMYGLQPPGEAARAAVIDGIWQRADPRAPGPERPPGRAR
ncbi:MAG: acid phosphatase [Betaproteobacteria bacterium]|nr:acid phosphatase [Betaproteobacteria bacterium]